MKKLEIEIKEEVITEKLTDIEFLQQCFGMQFMNWLNKKATKVNLPYRLCIDSDGEEYADFGHKRYLSFTDFFFEKDCHPKMPVRSGRRRNGELFTIVSPRKP